MIPKACFFRYEEKVEWCGGWEILVFSLITKRREDTCSNKYVSMLENKKYYRAS